MADRSTIGRAMAPNTSVLKSRATARHVDRLLWQGLRQGRFWTAVLLVTSLADTAAMLALPAVFAAAVDSQVDGAGSGHAMEWLIAVLLALVVCEVLGQLATPLSVASASRALRHRLLHHVLALGMRARERFTPGDVVTRLVSATEEAGGAGPALANAVSSLIVSAGGSLRWR
jgi:ATP-binding cassette, subfamily B, bacterial